MKIIEFIKRLFRVKKKLRPKEQNCEQVFRRLGYRKSGPASWQRLNGPCRTIITRMNGGIHIKVYGYGYAESDFLPGPIDDMEKLKRFIWENQV